jgi:hypothetical protein
MVVRRFRLHRGVIRGLLAGAMVAGSFVAGEIRREAVVPHALPAPPVAKLPQLAHEVEDAEIPHPEVLREGSYTARLKKRVARTFPDGEKIYCSWVELEKHGRKVLTLSDRFGLNKEWGNEATFEFADLGEGERMLIADQSDAREGHTVIAALSPRPRIIFESSRYSVLYGRPIDIDNDGTPEIVADSYNYQYMWVAGTGRFIDMTETVFRYDRVAGSYYPANPEFPAYLLPQIEKVKQRVVETAAKSPDPNQEAEMMCSVISVMVGYAMLGEEQTGWAYFNQYYSNKSELRAELQKRLAEDPAYQAIRKRKR